MKADLIELWDEYLEYKRLEREQLPRGWSAWDESFRDFMWWLKEKDGGVAPNKPNKGSVSPSGDRLAHAPSSLTEQEWKAVLKARAKILKWAEKGDNNV